MDIPWFQVKFTHLGRWVKVELCLCVGKKLYDKRQALKDKEDKKKINLFKK